jgi:hypothetical protein
MFLDGSPKKAIVNDVNTIKVKGSKVEVCGKNPRDATDSLTESVNCSFPPVFKQESGFFTLQVSMSGDVPKDFALTIPDVS